MTLNEFVRYNWLDLSHNYNNRHTTSSFNHFCEYVFVGMKNKAWLPKEYTNNIIFYS